VGGGSGLRESEYDSISEKCHPVSFVKKLLSQDLKGLEDESGVAANRLTKIWETVVDRERLDQLYELQLTDFDDVIEVMLRVGKEEYKPIEELAHGQKCMVVLMVALAEGDFPLVVDQPEDALHAPGIEEGIVSTMRSRRGIRQCIFATRNANIIVSADAEQILALKSDAHKGVLASCGCLDRFKQKELVIYHVEGGPEAFQRRQRIYYLAP
jgi:ABC-type Mn2+/Zn2+ transport system ATPase subunit